MGHMLPSLLLEPGGQAKPGDEEQVRHVEEELEAVMLLYFPPGHKVHVEELVAPAMVL